MKEIIREIILNAGADVCGLANVDRFRKMEPGFRPSDIWPKCKTVICLGVALPKGLTCVPSRMIYARYNSLVCDMATMWPFAVPKQLKSWGLQQYLCRQTGRMNTGMLKNKREKAWYQ